jgi:putative membrane protein
MRFRPWLCLLLLFTSDLALADVSADPDSVLLIGELADPVCAYQHGMFGVDQKACAMVPGRVDQGMAFFDIRNRRLYPVIGMTHTKNPREEFLALLGDTVAIRARVWKSEGGAALSIHTLTPVREQPRARYRPWPVAWQPSVLVGCGLIALAYFAALARRREGGNRRDLARAATFVGGLVVVVFALNGPVHDLSELYLFSAHMAQHILLSEVFPPLLLLGMPPWMTAALFHGRRARVWRLLTAPPVSFTIYSLVLLAWHLPPLYDLLMRSHGFHILMHLMIMGASIPVWWTFLGNAPEAPRPPLVTRIFFAASLALPMMAVAVSLLVARGPIYLWYALAPRLIDLSPLQDQRLGGAIMLVVGGLSFWIAAFVLYLRSRGEPEPA